MFLLSPIPEHIPNIVYIILLLYCRMNAARNLLQRATMISINNLPNSPNNNTSKTNITIINGPTFSNSRVLPNTFNAETPNETIVSQAIEIFQHFTTLNMKNNRKLTDYIIRVAKKCIKDDDAVNLGKLFIGTTGLYTEYIYHQFFFKDDEYNDTIKNTKP